MGYVVHRWLHSTKVLWMRDRHMEHHLVHYPPKANQHTEFYSSSYKKNWYDRVGLEWIIPISTITIPFGIILALFGIPWNYLLAAVAIALIYTWFMFDYLHVHLHLKNSWLLKNYVTKGWFRETRRLHSIHHNDMTVNFGIGFFWYDKLYETFTRKLKRISSSDGRALD